MDGQPDLAQVADPVPVLDQQSYRVAAVPAAPVLALADDDAEFRGLRDRVQAGQPALPDELVAARDGEIHGALVVGPLPPLRRHRGDRPWCRWIAATEQLDVQVVRVGR